jgi:hypothetical protein
VSESAGDDLRARLAEIRLGRESLGTAGWEAVVDGYPEVEGGTRFRESLFADWGFLMGIAYTLALGDGMNPEAAARAAFRVARDQQKAMRVTFEEPEP